jgi:hypothetical protein
MSTAPEEVPLPSIATNYIDSVITQIKCPRYLKEEIRRELIDHMEDALRHCTNDETAKRNRRQSSMLSGTPLYLRNCPVGVRSVAIGAGSQVLWDWAWRGLW